MKNQISSAVAPGATSDISSSMPQNEVSSSSKNRINLALRSVFNLFSVLCLLIFLSNVLNAQNNDTLSVLGMGLSIEAPAITLDLGDTAVIEVMLGTIDEPVNDLVEFSIELELDSRVSFPLIPEVGADSSWFFEGSEVGMTVETDTAENLIRITGVRPAGQSGHGRLFSLELISGANGLPAARMIKQAGGIGIITVDDIGFKQGSPANDPSLDPVSVAPEMYPNPCRGTLNFTWSEEAPERVQVIDLQGQIIASISPYEIQQGRWDTANLPHGLYRVIFSFTSGEQLAKALVVQ